MVTLFPLGSSGPGGNFFFEDRPTRSTLILKGDCNEKESGMVWMHGSAFVEGWVPGHLLERVGGRKTHWRNIRVV